MDTVELAPVTFGAQATGSSAAPLAAPFPRSSTRHVERRKLHQRDSPPCDPWDSQCWATIPCSIIASDIVHGLWIPSEATSSANSLCTQIRQALELGAGNANPPSGDSPGPTTTTVVPTSPSSAPHSDPPSSTPSLAGSSNPMTTNAPTGQGDHSSQPLSSTASGSEGTSVGPSPSFSSPASTLVIASTSTSESPSGPLASSHTSGSAFDATRTLPSSSPLHRGTSGALPTAAPTDPHRPSLKIGAIVGIALAVFATVLAIALAIFFLVRRHARRRSKRMLFKSSWKRLEEHSYDDGQRRPVSSIWSWFSSVDVDPDFERKREPSTHTSDSRFAEKDADSARLGSEAYYALGPSPCSFQTPAETQPLARGMPSVHSLHEGLSHPNIPVPFAPAASSASELLALTGTDYRTGGVLERKASHVSNNSYTTARSGDVQSVEAL